MSLFFRNEEKREFIGFRRGEEGGGVEEEGYKPTTPLIFILSISLPLSHARPGRPGNKYSCVISAPQKSISRTKNGPISGGGRSLNKRGSEPINAEESPLNSDRRSMARGGRRRHTRRNHGDGGLITPTSVTPTAISDISESGVGLIFRQVFLLPLSRK